MDVSPKCGRRQTLLLSLTLFALAAVAAGTANSAATLIVARAIEGVASAAIIPAGLALVTTALPRGEHRNHLIALNGAIAAGGFVGGVAIGGGVTQVLGWRAAVLACVPLTVTVIIGIITAPTILPVRRPPPGRPIPVKSATALTASLSLLGYSVATATNVGVRVTIVTLAAGLGLFGLVVRLETTARARLIPAELGSIQRVAVVGTVVAFASATNGGVIVTVTLYLQQTLKYAPIAAAVTLLAPGVASLAGGRGAVRATQWRGAPSALIFGVGLQGVGASLLLAVSVSRGLPVIIAGTVIADWGSWRCRSRRRWRLPMRWLTLSTVPLEPYLECADAIGGALGIAVLVAVATSRGAPVAVGPTRVATVSLAGMRFAVACALVFVVCGLGAASLLNRGARHLKGSAGTG